MRGPGAAVDGKRLRGGGGRCSVGAALRQRSGEAGPGVGSRAGSSYRCHTRSQSPPQPRALPRGRRLRSGGRRWGCGCASPSGRCRAGWGGAKMAARWLWRRLCQVRCVAAQGTRQPPPPPPPSFPEGSGKRGDSKCCPSGSGRVVAVQRGTVSLHAVVAWRVLRTLPCSSVVFPQLVRVEGIVNR